MVEKGIRGGICHATHRYPKASNKYMKNYDLNTGSSYLMYWDVNSLYGQAMQQKLPVDGSRWKKKKYNFTQKLIQRYDDHSDKGYILEVDVSYPKHLEIHSDLPFLLERMNIGKCQKLCV